MLKFLLFPFSVILTCMLALLVVHDSRGAAGQEVIHHELTLALHPEAQSLEAVDKLTIKSPSHSGLRLTLSPSARIKSVSSRGVSLPFTFSKGQLEISAPSQDRELQVEISYDASFHDPVPTNPVNTEDPSYGIAGTISPAGVFLSSEAHWYPDIPGSRPTFLVRVQAPEGMAAVTSGKRVAASTEHETTTSAWETAHPLPGISLSAGHYVIAEGDGGGVPILTYFYSEDAPLSGRYIKAVADYLQLYRSLIGDYPFHKYAVVENFFPTGYGFPSYTLIGSVVLRLPFIVDTSLGHEVAHSWWGNSVLVDYKHGNWSEGLTTYIADYLYKEMASPEEGIEYRLQILRDYTTLAPPGKDFPLSEFTSRFNPASRAVGYGKGAMVFHMVRQHIGNDAFWRGLRDVYQQKRFKEASWDDFAAALGKAGGRDLTAFFDQWVKRAGAPMLALENVEASRMDSGEWKVTGQVTQVEPFFDIEVPVQVDTGTGSYSSQTTVPLHGRSAPFELRATSGSPPRRIVVDPEANVFRRLYASEIPPTVNEVRAASDSLQVVAARGISSAVLGASKTLLASFGLENAPIVQEGNTRPDARSKDKDVLYIGFPEGGLNPSEIPEGLQLGPSSFTVDNVTYTSPGDALFVVLSKRTGRQRFAAIFLPLSASAAQAAARKIVHYGKYSCLVFRDGTNLVKRTWPVTASPLIHDITVKETSP